MGGERPRGGIETDSEAFDFQFLLSINACKKNVCHRVSGECFFFFFFFFFYLFISAFRAKRFIRLCDITESGKIGY